MIYGALLEHEFIVRRTNFTCVRAEFPINPILLQCSVCRSVASSRDAHRRLGTANNLGMMT